jgi:hypothetical protein
MTTSLPCDPASFPISIKLSSSATYNFISDFWNINPYASVNPVDTIKAPPFISRVAASGTTKTFIPNWVKSYLIAAIAVVLPAQGPPVKQILTMLNLSSIDFVLFIWKSKFAFAI